MRLISFFLRNNRVRVALPLLVGAIMWAVLPLYLTQDSSAQNAPPPGTVMPTLVARLTGVPINGRTPMGRAEYRVNPANTSPRVLNVFVQNLALPANAMLDVVVDTTTVGQLRMATNGFGYFVTDSVRTPSLPMIVAGTTITLRQGNLMRMNGVFATPPPVPSPSPRPSPSPQTSPSPRPTPSPVMTPSPRPSPSPRPTPPPARLFGAHLSGRQEVPPVQTMAVGFGHVLLNQDETQIQVSLGFFRLSSNQTAAGINGPALPGANAPVIFNIGAIGGTQGFFPPQTFDVTPEQVADLRAGKWYFNISSADNPTGEIRGQIRSRRNHGDFDGDGMTDVSLFRPTTGDWEIVKSSDDTLIADNMGGFGDVNVTGDFDGDGMSDIAVFDTNGTWHIRNSSDGVERSVQWGLPTDIPVVGDYDGDGRSDLTVFRDGLWYTLRSSDGTWTARQWGRSGNIPLAGDFDGDGITDVAVFITQKNTWWVQRSSDGSAYVATWGNSGDVPVVGDFDGDGSSDITVFRPSSGTWFTYRSSDNGVMIRQFGVDGDIPVLGEYDNDTVTDIAVFRASEGRWYIWKSTNGAIVVKELGSIGDIPAIVSP